MPGYDKHVFVCVNERDPSNPKGCCKAKSGEEIRARLKDAVGRAGLQRRIRVNAAGCLDQCAQGVAIVVYPEGVWYGHVTLADVDEIFESHLLGGVAVERLRLPPARKPE